MGWRPKNWEEIKPQETDRIGIYSSQWFSNGVERGADAVLEALMFECAFEAVMSNARKEVEAVMSEQRRGKFWVVWIEEESYFTLIVDSKEPAYKEAERLARLNPGKLVYLLEAVEYCQATPIEWESL